MDTVKFLADAKQLLSIVKMSAIKNFQDKKKLLLRIDKFTEKYPAEMIPIDDEQIFELWSDVLMEYHRIKQTLSNEEFWSYMKLFESLD